MLQSRNYLLFILVGSLQFFCLAQEEPIYTVYLIGDTGEPNLEGDDVVFTALQERISKKDKNSAIVFLGDNIYHNGLPAQGDPGRAKAELKMNVQLDAVQDFKGEVYYVPGNHDWNDAKPDGIDYIKREEAYIESYLDRGDVLIPDDGCPGPETKKLGKNVLLIALDSQWWLHPSSDTENEDCKNKNVTQIIDELKSILDKEDDKHIIIAMHHPIFSDGSHNGYYQLKDHLFPLASLKKNLYIPLPGLGSLYPFFRSTFGAKQDMPHPLYQKYRKDILEALIPYRNVVVASGHEHNLQYFYKNENHFIKSGSGSKSSTLPSQTDAVYSSSDKGYAQLDYYKNGEVLLKYFGVDNLAKEEEIYTSMIVEAKLKFAKNIPPYSLEVNDQRMQASQFYKSKKFHRSIFGQLYRDDWSTATTFPALNLSTIKEGLTPIKVGGGYSSKSIRLKGKDKRQFVLRSVEKGVRKVVPPGFEGTLVESIFQDQISASQPYAALMVPDLARAIGVYHTNPELVYLPKQPLLGDYNDIYGDALYLFEERPSGNQEDQESFGNSRKIISYVDMLDKIQQNSKHHIHQEQVLRSRLFDIFLGDWDRHDDQWRWASFKEKNHDGGGETHTYYEPIPRDRDQVFYKYKGLVPMIARLASPQLRKFQNFEEDIKNIEFLGFNARHFDRSFLNELDKSIWLTLAEEFQSNMTDEVIEKSISSLPPEIIKLRGEEYLRVLKARRAKMKSFASDYYDFLAKYVDVVGTAKREQFEVIRNENGSTDVVVHQLKKDGSLDDQLYKRIFPSGETREVRLYGLKNDDQFVISGEHSNGPIIRIVGGKGQDKINDTSKLKGGKKSVILYDSVEGNEVSLGNDGLDKRSADYKDNLYDRAEFYYKSSVGIPFLSVNPDDLVALSYSLDLKTYGFRKAPFDTRHRFNASYSYGRKKLGLSYDLHKTKAFGNVDFGFNTHLFLPSNVNNFFGLSNEKTFEPNDLGKLRYFRFDQVDLMIHPSLRWSSENGVSVLSIGPYFQYFDLKDNDDKFIAEDALSGLPSSAFENKSYSGIRAEYSLKRVDSPSFPTKGMIFNIRPSYNVNIQQGAENFTQLQGDLTLYNYLWMPRPLVLATRINWGVNFGDNYNFFQANYAGRSAGLRAFKERRFGGRSSFVISNDLRLPLFKVRSGSFPFSMGIMGSLDLGRVWTDGEDSDTWHTSYGGGFWISPFDLMPISFNYMTSKENATQVLISFGFSI